MEPLLTFNVLGPFQAFDRDRPLTAFPTDKVRALLLYLAMEADIPHRRESLAALLYPERSDRDAAGNFRKTLFRLRGAIGESSPALSDALFDVTRSTVQLNSRSLDLDAGRFRAGVAGRLNRNRLSGDDVERLAAAAALYRGELAAGLTVTEAQPFEEWLMLQRLAWHQQALHVCDVLATAYESRGDYVRGQEYARRALALEPWREEAHVNLIRLLASNGQRTEALAQFEQCRRLLAEEMGMEPGDEALELVARVRDGSFRPQPHDAAAPRVHLHRFPAQFTSFIGRERDLKTVVDQLLDPECRMVTLVAAGGMGKTRLSVQAAQRLAQNDPPTFPDGLYFVDAAPLVRVEDLPTAIALALGLVLQGETAPLTQVQDHLRARTLLLVIDNLEQIVECGPDLGAILAACPGLKILATSREPLRIRAEWRYELDGLEREGVESSAAQLFIHRARQVLPAFTPSEADQRAIQRIALTVAGNPLALELAATWLRFYDCSAIAGEIDRGVDFLESDLRDVPQRHRSIRVLFDHSWQLLSAPEQRALRQLSVLRGDWTLAQGTSVADGTPRELVRLADKSLIRRAAGGRYTIDELIRQFAYGRLAGDELRQVRYRSAAFFLNGLVRQHHALHGLEPQPAAASVRADWVNIRHAWTTAVALRRWELLEPAIEPYQMFVELTGLVTDGLTDFQELLAAAGESLEAERVAAMARAVLARWYYRRAQYDLAGSHVQALLELPERDDLARSRGQAWYVRASVQMAMGTSETALVCAEEALRLFEIADDSLGKAHVAALRANYDMKRGAFEAALALATSAFEQYEKLHYPLGMMRMLSRMGIIYRRRAAYQESLAHHFRCLELVEKLDAPSEVARHHNNIGAVYRNLHEYEKAIEHFRRAIEADELIGHRRGLAMEKGNLGLVFQETYRYEEALRHYAEAVDIARAIGLKGVEANFTGCRGELYGDLGEFERAKQELEAAVSLAREIGNHPTACIYAGALAWVRFRLGETAQAMFQMDEAAAEQARFNLRDMLALSLHLKAEMHADLGEYAAALRSVDDAVALREEIGVDNLALMKSRVLQARLRARLGEREIAVRQLEALVEQARDEEARAVARFGLWEASPDEANRLAAQAALGPLYARTRRDEQRVWLAALAPAPG